MCIHCLRYEQAVITYICAYTACGCINRMLVLCSAEKQLLQPAHARRLHYMQLVIFLEERPAHCA